jgi:hypothetical protein
MAQPEITAGGHDGADRAARHLLLLDAAMTGERDALIAALEQHHYQGG